MTLWHVQRTDTAQIIENEFRAFVVRADTSNEAKEQILALYYDPTAGDPDQPPKKNYLGPLGLTRDQYKFNLQAELLPQNGDNAVIISDFNGKRTSG
jgi:hypothetical protein